MTTDPTVAQVLDKKAGKILLDMRTPRGPRMRSAVRIRRQVAQWMSAHSTSQIAGKVPADYSQGDEALYAQAIKSTLPMFTKDLRLTA
jgi:NitT/TauT family transport system substrate-binding protein